MIEYRKGNLLDVTEGVIVHGCNAQGVMGSGVAKVIKDKYPDCYIRYKRCVTDSSLGDVIWYSDDDEDKLIIANALTQESYGRTPGARYVDYVALHKCFYNVFNSFHCESDCVNFPKIGAGLGGGSWEIIEQLILAARNIADSDAKLICWEI